MIAFSAWERARMTCMTCVHNPRYKALGPTGLVWFTLGVGTVVLGVLGLMLNPPGEEHLAGKVAPGTIDDGAHDPKTEGTPGSPLPDGVAAERAKAGSDALAVPPPLRTEALLEPTPSKEPGGRECASEALKASPVRPLKLHPPLGAASP